MSAPTAYEMPELVLMRSVVMRAAAAWGVTESALMGRGRAAAVAAARRLALALMRHLTALSFAEIGALFRVHPGTVLHACRCMAGRLKAGGNREAFHFLKIREELKPLLLPAMPAPMPEAASLF